MHVHADGCGDLTKYGPGRQYGGEVNGEDEMLVEAACRRDCVEAVYPPGDFQYDADTEWTHYDDLHVAPCCSFLDGKVAWPEKGGK